MLKRKFILFLLFALIMSAGAFILVEKNAGGSGVNVLLIGLDGASIDILNRLFAENKLPNLRKLVDDGALGHLDSLSWRKKISGSHGYFSPIVWSTIATGKTPDKHGVEDFVLPLPGTVQFRIGHANEEELNEAVLDFPFNTRDRTRLAIQARAAGLLKSVQLQVSLNGKLLGTHELKNQFEEFHFDIDPQLVHWNGNKLKFRYDNSQKMGNNRIAVDMDFVRLFDSQGQMMKDYHPGRDKDAFVSGWVAEAPFQVTQASSYHFRTRTIWEIASKFNRKIAVVGWWATWPAFPVNGYMITSQAGLQGERRTHIRTDEQTHLDVIPDLTYPPNYIQQLKSLYKSKDSMAPEFSRRFFELGKCGCIGSKQEHIVLERFWQDDFFGRITQSLMDQHDDFNLTAVYFRGTDTISHQFLGLQENTEYRNSVCEGKSGCDMDRIKHIVDNYYAFVDEQIGEILKRRQKNTITFVVTDHGEASFGTKGNHKNNGFIIAQGPGIRRHTFVNATVLDITPTILYLLNLPVGQDMDGNVMKEVFQRELLEQKPLAYIDSYDRIIPPVMHKVEVSQEMDDQNMEELKANGYIN